MSKKSTNSLEGHLQKKRQWLSKFQNVLRRGLSLLDQDLQAPSHRTLISIADSLGDVATYYGTEGTVQVSDGDASGWSRIHMAAAFRFWATKIRAKCFTSSAFLAPVSRIPNLTNYSALSACLLCYSTANHLDAWQAETLEILQGIGTWPGAISESYWAERVFEPFVLRLHQRLGHFDMPEVLEARDLGVYNRVLIHWDDPEALAAALHGMCDYHCSNMEDMGGDWDPEFKYPPFDLLACEVLAVSTIRERIGLPSPRIDHPLVSTPLSAMKPIRTTSKDDLLRRVEAAYCNIFPGSN